MRRSIVAGNWKMHKDHTEGAGLAREILAGLEGTEPASEVVLIPPFTTLPAVTDVTRGSIVKTGGQDLYYEDEGAFTGEISARMLKSLGCTYVLVGHSERRHILGERGDLLAKKLRAALKAGLVPIFCVGEVLEQREAGDAAAVVAAQIQEVLAGLSRDEIATTVVAYEPVWAIGTGRTATPQDAAEMHSGIRTVLEDLFTPELAESTVILYGGSVKPGNAAELMAEEEIDGVLVGGASLTASTFLGIIFPSP
ncbi:MAG: triose-phosphate isomerase [bacterium]|nr:MAG: triose-phosphate isomerase [bacterium]